MERAMAVTFMKNAHFRRLLAIRTEGGHAERFGTDLRQRLQWQRQAGRPGIRPLANHDVRGAVALRPAERRGEHRRCDR